MRKVNYRCFSIYAEPARTASGAYDVRVILQKIGTSKISLHRPCRPQPTSGEAENVGIASGKQIADEKRCPE